MRIIVTGAAGRLGTAMAVDLSAAGHAVTALRRDELDITNAEQVHRVITHRRPDVVLNCSAYNAVDDAERDPASAYGINRDGPAALARAADASGALLVHFSTDFVFDGRADVPYAEDSPTGPLNVYGASKLAGETAVRQTPRHFILRLESLFGGAGRAGHLSSVDYFADTLLAGGVVRAMADRVVSPSYVPDVVRATRELLQGGAPYGTYHCVNSGSTTWYALACATARALKVAERVHPIRSGDLTLAAPRPRFCALSNEKLRAAGVRMPGWHSALRRHLHARHPGAMSERARARLHSPAAHGCGAGRCRRVAATDSHRHAVR